MEVVYRVHLAVEAPLVLKLWTVDVSGLQDAPKAESGEMAVFVGSSRKPVQPKPRLRWLADFLADVAWEVQG
jgi:hypothetical protein